MHFLNNTYLIKVFYTVNFPRLADNRHSSETIDDLSTPPSYGRTFALGQTAVSLAYCLGEWLISTVLIISNLDIESLK